MRSNPAVSITKLLRSPKTYTLSIYDLPDGGIDLYLKQKQETIGHVRTDIGEGGWHRIRTAKAQNGYGPLLYDLLLELVDRKRGKGVTSDPFTVSPEAEYVWAYYLHHRPDVAHTFIGPRFPEREPLNYGYQKPFSHELRKLFMQGQATQR